MKQKYIDISIIIVSFNTRKLLKLCIESVVKYTKNINYEVIVVDNASTDGSLKYLSKLVTQNNKITLVKNSENLGFAVANNRGIKLAKGKYTLLLNSDTKLKKNVLKSMVEWMDEHQDVGISSCGLLNKDSTIQGSGGYFPTLPKVISWMLFVENIPFLGAAIRPFHPIHPRSRFYKGESFFKKPHEQDWVTGAFFLIRRQVIDEIGFLDEDYFMYVEEMDFCYRAKRKGWKVWLLPQWNIVHFGQGSGKAELAILSEYRNIKLFYKKHFSHISYLTLRVFLFIGALLRIVIFGILEGGESASVYVKALGEV